MLYRWHKKIDRSAYRAENLNIRKKLPVKRIRKMSLNKPKEKNANCEFKIINNYINEPDFFIHYNLRPSIKIEPRRRGL